ncbi:diguanylate cyclase [Persephonella sp.]
MFFKKSKECLNEFLGVKGKDDTFFSDKNACLKEITPEDIEKEFKNLAFLRFSEKLEDIFKSYFVKVKINQIRFAMAFGIFLYSVFAVLDYLIFPEVMYDLWIIRTFMVLIGFFFLLYTYFSPNKGIIELLMSVLIFVGGIGVLLMIILIDLYVEKAHIYYAGLLLVVFFAYTFSSVRLVYATVPAFFVTVAYIFADVTYIKTDKMILINNAFFLLSANVMGIFAGYILEYFFRKNFLQSFLIFLEKKQTDFLNKKLYELSITDELTDVANRRFFQEFLEREINRAVREKYSISLLIIDVDNFKEYNDTFGHTAGDLCLKKIATVLKRYKKRPYDLVARYGGDEFVIVLPKAPEEYTYRVAESIRSDIERLNIKNKGSMRNITVSIGVAVLNGNVSSGKLSKDLINTADKALYTAKRKGRNRVVKLKI